MSTEDKTEYDIACASCGYRGQIIRETNDNGYAKRYYEDWSIVRFLVEKRAFWSGRKLTAQDALEEFQPRCTDCGSDSVLIEVPAKGEPA